MRVKFNYRDEFRDNLVKDCVDDGPDRGIVRVTIRRKREGTFPLVQVYLIAGYTMGDEVVTLEEKLGEYMSEPMDTKVRDDMKAALAWAEELAADNSLDLRAGCFEEK